MSVAVALTLGLTSGDAAALALGRLKVQSALGEPLRAEIDVTEISAGEADGLKLNIAAPGAFSAAGVAYNAALSDVRVSLHKRPDGRYVVRLNGGRAMNDPFLDLLLEANSSTGRIVRDYTVLLDPPAARQAAAPVAPTAPQMGFVPPPPRASAPSPIAGVVAPPPPRQRPTPAVVPTPTPAAATAPSDAGQQVTVKRGDTANKIASAHKPADVSLDQMLVALLRANPKAFIGSNVNRMKAGAVLDVPSAEQAGATGPREASRTVKAHSRDFNSYRRRLAENAPDSRTATADRQASGKLQASVEARNAAASASPDKLSISQGGPAGSTAEDKLAQTRQAQATQERTAELAKNLADLKKLQAASGAPAAAPVSPAAPASAEKPAPVAVASPPAVVPAPSTPAPAPVVEGATPVVAASATESAAPAPEADAATAETVTEPEAEAAPAVAAPPPKAAAPAPAPVAEPSFFAGLLDNPLVLGAGALLAALIAFLLYRVLGRRRPESADSVFLESRMPRDSFFGVSGGQQVDTNERSTSGASSMAYSPSQLDAGDVDPVAEADVYMAYGRDLQAEEILREAMRTNPERAAIPLKLLEIHAKRRDLRAFEALATDVQTLTGGTGADWVRATELGRELDPGNPLYQANTLATPPAPAPVAVAPLVSEPLAASSPAFMPSVAPLDFDLALPAAAPAPVAAVSAALPLVAASFVPATLQDAPAALQPAFTPDAPLLDALHLGDLDTTPGALEPLTHTASLTGESTQPTTLNASLKSNSGFIEFDLASLSSPAELDDTQPGQPESLDDAGEHPHAIKLSLARELQALGDTEGARSLVEEVAAEASPDLKVQARQLLAQLA